MVEEEVVVEVVVEEVVVEVAEECGQEEVVEVGGMVVEVAMMMTMR